MIFLIYKFRGSFSWISKFLMASFFVMFAIKAVVNLLMKIYLYPHHINDSDTNIFKIVLLVSYTLDNYLEVLFVYIGMQIKMALIWIKPLTDDEKTSKFALIARYWKNYLITYISLYGYIVLVRCYFEFTSELNRSYLNWLRILLVTHYLTCLALATLDMIANAIAVEILLQFCLALLNKKINSTIVKIWYVFCLLLFIVCKIVKDIGYPLQHA